MQNKKQLPKEILKALSNRDVLTRALFKRPDSLSALLPYDEYIEDGNIYQNKDGSLGAIFEVDLIEHEPLTEHQVIEAVKSVKSWFSLPENCVLQILYDQSALTVHDIKFKTIESHYTDQHPLSKTLFEERLSKIKRACKNQGQSTPLERKTYLSIRYFPEYRHKKKVKEALGKGEALLFSQMKEYVKELRCFKHLIKDIEANSKIRLKRLEAQAFLDVLRRFFNPVTYFKRSFAKFNSNIPLSCQFLYNSPVLDYPGIEREGIKTRTLSLKTSPQYAYPGGMAYFTKLDFPYRLSLNLSFPGKGKVKRFFDLKEFFLQNSPSAKARRQREDVLEAQDKLARDDRCVHMTFNVIIEGQDDEILDERTRKLVSIFHNDLECEVIVEDDIGLGLCLSSLPLNYTPDGDLSAARFIRILRSDLINFIPIFDSFRGLKHPLSLYISRENSLVPFSLLENETSNHTVVLADSGSGKSAFVIDCIQAAKRMSPEPLIFIIDKKSSYTMLSEYFEGDLTIFDRNAQMPFTPFRGIYDEEKIAFLSKLIISCIKLISPSFVIESEHQSAISDALRKAYIKKCDQNGIRYIQGELLKQSTQEEVELTMEDFITELGSLHDSNQENLSAVTEPLIQKLKPFYSDGMYSNYFRGARKSNTSKSKLFYAYDLDAVDSDPILQTILTMAVIEEIRQIIKLPEHKGRTGFIVFEEFAMLGRNNPAMRDFAIVMAETCRKLGIWLITLTPRPQNYFELDVGQAFWAVADNYIFLQMNADNVDYLAKHSSLLDEANTEIIKSLRTINGKYADVFYMNKKKTRQGAFRYIQTSLDKWLAPTNAKDAREADKALKKFENKWQALEYLSKTFPHDESSG